MFLNKDKFPVLTCGPVDFSNFLKELAITHVLLDYSRDSSHLKWWYIFLTYK